MQVDVALEREGNRGGFLQSLSSSISEVDRFIPCESCSSFEVLFR